MTDLQTVIRETTLADSHEHLRKEADYVAAAPDILQHLFDNYVIGDLQVAGCPGSTVQALLNRDDPDIAARFAAVAPYWQRVQHTGYGEATRHIARRFFELDELTPATIATAAPRAAALSAPGERLRLLRDVANLDHVQVDDFIWPCLPDASGPEFFLYDLSIYDFSCGKIDTAALAAEGLHVHDLASLRESITAIFDRYAPTAIAVKTQMAYDRTLAWEPRTDADAAGALARILLDPAAADPTDRLCLGDWCLARGVEQAMEHGLPMKIHTGYMAGCNYMKAPLRLNASLLAGLFADYTDARFVLMHTAYPYTLELIALAKHFANVYVDMCWAWSIDPWSSVQFVRHLIHAVPSHKLFVFGGDTFLPTAAVAYCDQARHWLGIALAQEIADGLIAEPQAIRLARAFMQQNQADCFDLQGTRQAIRAAMQS